MAAKKAKKPAPVPRRETATRLAKELAGATAGPEAEQALDNLAKLGVHAVPHIGCVLVLLSDATWEANDGWRTVWKALKALVVIMGSTDLAPHAVAAVRNTVLAQVAHRLDSPIDSNSERRFDDALTAALVALGSSVTGHLGPLIDRVMQPALGHADADDADEHHADAAVCEPKSKRQKILRGLWGDDKYEKLERLELVMDIIGAICKYDRSGFAYVHGPWCEQVFHELQAAEAAEDHDAIEHWLRVISRLDVVAVRSRPHLENIIVHTQPERSVGERSIKNDLQYDGVWAFFRCVGALIRSPDSLFDNKDDEASRQLIQRALAVLTPLTNSGDSFVAEAAAQALSELNLDEDEEFYVRGYRSTPVKTRQSKA